MSRKYREPEEVPNKVIADRLDELASVVAGGDRNAISREFVMRIPAELDRCPDLVMSIAASRLRELEEKAEAFDWLSKQSVQVVPVEESVGAQLIRFERGITFHNGKDLLECVRKARGEE